MVRQLPNVRLAEAQEAIAQAAGYADWHDLDRHHAEGPMFEPDKAAGFRGRAEACVACIASKLPGPLGEIQDAVSRGRLIHGVAWTLEDHVAVRMSLWRRTRALGNGPGAPGSLVSVRGDGSVEIGYLRYYGKPTDVLLDTGLAVRGDMEVSVLPRHHPDFLPARLWLPYGVWTVQDGSEILFSRDYLPLWRLVSGRVERLPPWLWISDIAKQRWFSEEQTWAWARDPGRKHAMEALVAHGAIRLPMLADVMPLLLRPDVANMKDAVALMARSWPLPDPVGPWCRAPRFAADRRAA